MSNKVTPPSLPNPNADDDVAQILSQEKLKSRISQWLEPLVLLAPSGLWLLLLLVLPTLVIFELSLVPGIRPGDVVNPSGLDNYFVIFQSVYLKVIGRSLFFAVGTTIFCLLLGFPVAYWLGKMAPQRWRNLLLLGFILPLWTSSLLRTYAWITILRPTGVLNTFLVNPIGGGIVRVVNEILLFLSLNPLPIAPEDLRLNLLYEWQAVLIGMTYSYLPYMVLILYAAVDKLDKELLEASADLGAKPWQTFWKVTVPQTFPGIAAASLLVFITSLGDFIDPELLGGAGMMTTARLIYNQFLGATRNWGFGSALSMVLILGVSIAIALLLRYGDTSNVE